MEKEKRAAMRAFSLLPFTILIITPVFVVEYAGEWPVMGMLILSWFLIILLIFPTRFFERKVDMDKPVGQINEKTVMLSRKLLDPGSERYEKYYEAFPGHKEPDMHFRSKPGLLNEHATFYDPFAFNIASAILESVKAFHPIVDGEPAQKTSGIEAGKIATSVRKWILREGAVSVGFTKTHGYHWYSVIGRGDDFGKRAQLPHSHAIAFTVEMDKEFMDTAPHAPTVIESAHQYMRAAVIATEVAMMLRKLGYHARAHIDGNYRVVCPLVARDAGLGEIGRMGLLMTPELGPRVRIGVVTTDLDLPSAARRDFSDMIDFCRICKKCAHVCPASAIPIDDRKDIGGVKRWQIKQEDCYTYWCISGTDCGRCMSDCPFSHPNNFFHNMIRVLIRNSIVFRHFALKMDDFFYGRKPKPAPVPEWLKAK
jgi:reductive dehalogenase